MKSDCKQKKTVSAEAIARQADAGRDVSHFFTNTGRRMAPVRRVNVDFAASMLAELDQSADELNISRQAVIKTLVRQALDQRYLASAGRPATKRPPDRTGTRHSASSPAGVAIDGNAHRSPKQVGQ